MNLLKNYVLILGVGLLGMMSCSDKDSLEEIDDSRLPAIEEGCIDITGGYNVIMVDVDKIKSFRHKLGTRRNIKLTVTDDLPFTFHVETAPDTTRYIVIKPKENGASRSEEPLFKVVDLNVALADGSASKDVKMVLHKSVSGTQNVSSYAYNIGKGTKEWADLGNVTFEVLDFDKIQRYLSVNPVQDFIKFECGGERYSETMERMSVKVGLSGLGKVTQGTKTLFSLTGGATFSQEEYTHNISNFEVYLGYYGKVMAEVKLDPTEILSRKLNGTLYALLDSAACDILNNPGTPGYKLFPNDSTGIFRLLDHFGTNVITQASFGGNYMYMYGRKENAYEHSIGHDASAYANMKFPKNNQTGNTWLSYYQSTMSTPYLNLEGNGSDYSAEYERASKAWAFTKGTGGDAVMDIESWDKKFSTESPEKWVIVSYTTKDSEGKGNLLSITEFVTDDARRNAIKKYFNAYNESKVKEMKEDSLVIADFMMKLGKERDVKKHRPSDDPKSFVGTGPDGKEYVYYPLMANDNAPDFAGYAFETGAETDDFAVGTGDNAHYWYYALGYDSECDGITDIRFDNEEFSGWTRRGNHANDGINGALDNNYVMVRCGDSNTKYSDKIKAVCLTRSLNYEGTNGAERIMASTGGAQWMLPFQSSTTKKDFKDYWDKVELYTPEVQFYIGGLSVKNAFYVGYSKKSIGIGELSFGDMQKSGKIVHPKKWGE